jgi:hypothetical protein
MKITTEDFIKKAKELHIDKNYDYSKVVYIKANLKVEIICPIHGSFFQTPNSHNSLKYPQNCPNCKKTKKSNIDEFIEKAKKVHGDKYDYSFAEYINCHKPMKIFCKEHNVFFMQNSNNHLQGQNCPCGKIERISKSNTKYTQLDFIKLAQKKHGKIFDYSLVEFKDVKSVVKIICKKHNYVFNQVADNHLRSIHCCPECLKEKSKRTNKKTKEEFIKEAVAIHGDLYNYDYVNYINGDTKVKIYCKQHKGFFEQIPRSHTHSKCGCYICNSSQGEVAVKTFLENNKIKFEQQKKFKDCKLKNHLPFDFYLKKYNAVIEYNGIQHYEFFKYFHKIEEEFNKRKERDKIKKEYCLKNNIKFIEIPYWEKDNIKSILIKELNLEKS